VTSIPEPVAERLAHGDEGALEECYRLYGPMVRSYLYRFVPAVEVDDVVQMTFLGLWQARARLDPRRPVEALLFSIARRRAIDVLRKRTNVVDASAMRDLVGTDGEAIVEQLAWAAEVRAALGQLADDQRRAIELAYFAQLTQKEIAEHLNIPLGTIKARMSRGMARLGTILGQRSTQ